MGAEGQSEAILENVWFITDTVQESRNTKLCTYQRETQTDKNSKWTKTANGQHALKILTHSEIY
jgi:hypothetical protein